MWYEILGQRQLWKILLKRTFNSGSPRSHAVTYDEAFFVLNGQKVALCNVTCKSFYVIPKIDKYRCVGSNAFRLQWINSVHVFCMGSTSSKSCKYMCLTSPQPTYVFSVISLDMIIYQRTPSSARPCIAI